MRDSQQMDSQADEVLVAASRHGDRRAFQHIVERYQAMVCAVTYSYLGDLMASEDAAQEAFLVAWQQLPTLRDPDRLRAWLAGIARNTARAAVRTRRSDRVYHASPLGDPVSHSTPSPDHAVASAEELHLLWQVLEQVPEVYREPLVLYYREHQSIAEVAATMGITEDNVKQRLARGRQALKEQVAVFVETTLRRSGPRAAFTAGVLAALDSVAGSASAAGIGTAGATAPGTTGAWMGILGGVLGSLIGIAGGIFGTMCSIMNAQPGHERQLMIRASIVIWIYTTLLVGVYLYIAFKQQWLFQSVWFQVTFWSIHVIVLITGITWINRKAALLRDQKPSSLAEEGKDARS